MKFLGIAAAAVSMVSAAQASTLIDFEDLQAYGKVNGSALGAELLTDELSDRGVIFGRDGSSAGIMISNAPGIAFQGTKAACGVGIDGSLGRGCARDIDIRFVDPTDGTTQAVVDSVSFFAGDGGGDFDSFVITSYDVNDDILEQLAADVISYTPFALTAPGIARVLIDFQNPEFGYGLDNLTFDGLRATGPVVPVPAAAFLFAPALLGLRRLGRRNR